MTPAILHPGDSTPDAARTRLPRDPVVYTEFVDQWADPARRTSSVEAWTSGRCSFVPHLLPEQALRLPASDVLAMLRARFGDLVDQALDRAAGDGGDDPAELPKPLRGPVAGQADPGWLRTANVVGVNVRTVGSFFDVVKYALTLPASQDAIHLLPVWEAGVVGSIYGMSSWCLNPEFHSAEMAQACPGLDTVERQLKGVVHLLHLCGKAVGMDVIPHVDRFSEISLAWPEHFEWLQREDVTIVSHSDDLYERVWQVIFEFVRDWGCARAEEPSPRSVAELFGPDVDEACRTRMLFGRADDFKGRLARRIAIMTELHRHGLEPVPATMSPPYRGLKVNVRPEGRILDSQGLVWREYEIERPQPMSRVFGPLTRYRLYESVDQNRAWEIDFSRPRMATWRYVTEKYREVQRRYGFDFMRGDMSHVQMRPCGVPDRLDGHYDILGAVKQAIREAGAPHFGYFAETFLAPKDVMCHGDEVDHLEAAEADVTLGDLQSTCVGSSEFLQRLRQYRDLLDTRLCAPSFTVITADKDDPRFDLFYQAGNEARFFLALALTDMPSYMGLGFEVRDVHFEPAPNEHYTKLFVFHETEGPRATRGPFAWGRNGSLFHRLTRIRLHLDRLWPRLVGRPVRWLVAPDATGAGKTIAWTHGDGEGLVFVVHTDLAAEAVGVGLPLVASGAPLLLDFSTAEPVPAADRVVASNGKHYRLSGMRPGEARIYRVGASDDAAAPYF